MEYSIENFFINYPLAKKNAETDNGKKMRPNDFKYFQLSIERRGCFKITRIGDRTFDCYPTSYCAYDGLWDADICMKIPSDDTT